MYDVIEQIEATICAPLLDDDRREILSAVISNYNEGLGIGLAHGNVDALDLLVKSLQGIAE